MTDTTGTFQTILVLVAMLMLFNGTQRHDNKMAATARKEVAYSHDRAKIAVGTAILKLKVKPCQ